MSFDQCLQVGYIPIAGKLPHSSSQGVSTPITARGNHSYVLLICADVYHRVAVVWGGTQPRPPPWSSLFSPRVVRSPRAGTVLGPAWPQSGDPTPLAWLQRHHLAGEPCPPPFPSLWIHYYFVLLTLAKRGCIKWKAFFF